MDDGKTIGVWKLLDPVWFLGVKVRGLRPKVFTSHHITHIHPHTHTHTHTHTRVDTHTHPHLCTCIHTHTHTLSCSHPPVYPPSTLLCFSTLCFYMCEPSFVLYVRLLCVCRLVQGAV